MKATIKARAQDNKDPIGLSALFPIVALLMAGMIAKFGVVTQLIHLAR